MGGWIIDELALCSLFSRSENTFFYRIFAVHRVAHKALFNYFDGIRLIDRTMDRLTKEQRHLCMAAIHGKDTKPERWVRKFLFSRGFRYRLNHPRLPGHPDLVLRKYRTVIFVNGCFWHGHEDCKYFRLPKTNTDFWQKKIARNKERDKAEQRQLAAMGWHCITVWECQLKPKVREQTLESLAYTLNHIFLEDRRLKPSVSAYDFPESDEGLMAAEPESSY